MLLQPAENELDKLLRHDFNKYLPDDLLVKEDRMSMAFGLEARVPFLDNKLVEFALSIPSSLKVRGFTTKYLLKRSLEGMLPKDIIYRRKHGFAVPISEWIKTELKEMISRKEIFYDEGERIFREAPCPVLVVKNPAEVEKLYKELG